PQCPGRYAITTGVWERFPENLSRCLSISTNIRYRTIRGGGAWRRWSITSESEGCGATFKDVHNSYPKNMHTSWTVPLVLRYSSCAWLPNRPRTSILRWTILLKKTRRKSPHNSRATRRRNPASLPQSERKQCLDRARRNTEFASSAHSRMPQKG